MEYAILNHLLTFWEDMHTTLDLGYRINQMYNKKYSSLPGSEISENFHLIMPIKKYQKLRQLLESGNPKAILDENGDIFLPTIPKGMEAQFENQRLRLVMEKMQSIHLTPVGLMSWAPTKKVCSIQNRQLIEEISPNVDNYLDKLPYHSFLLDIGEGIPFNYEFRDERQQYTGTVLFRHFLISRLEDHFYVLGIPENIKDYCEDDEDRAKIIQVIEFLKTVPPADDIKNKAKGNKALKKAASKMKHRFDAMNKILESRKRKSQLIDYILPIFWVFVNAIDIKTGNLSYRGINSLNTGQMGDGPIFMDHLLGTINGFCKLLAEHQIPEVLIDDEDQVLKEEVQKIDCQPIVIEEVSEKLKWYEVPINNIDFMKLHKLRGRLKVSITTGGEKSPHQRRGHPRVFRDENGIEIKRIWIKSLIVRKDKLLNGVQSKSGVLKV